MPELFSTETMNAFRRASEVGDLVGAEKLLLDALGRAKTARHLPANLLHVLHTFAATLCIKQKYFDAERIYSSVLGAREYVLGPNHPDTIDSLERLSVVVGETKGKIEATKLMFVARTRALTLHAS